MKADIFINDTLLLLIVLIDIMDTNLTLKSIYPLPLGSNNIYFGEFEVLLDELLSMRNVCHINVI